MQSKQKTQKKTPNQKPTTLLPQPLLRSHQMEESPAWPGQLQVTQHQLLLHGKTNPIWPRATRKAAPAASWHHTTASSGVCLAAAKAVSSEHRDEKPSQTPERQHAVYWAVEQGIGRSIAGPVKYCIKFSFFSLKKYLIWEQTRGGTGCTSGHEQGNIFPGLCF